MSDGWWKDVVRGVLGTIIVMAVNPGVDLLHNVIAVTCLLLLIDMAGSRSK